ncbi:MAG: hypothetical protein AAFS13_00675 [Pseudomonadota bacterium]
MTDSKQLTTSDIVEGSYSYMRSAAGPALIGIMIYAGMSSIGDYIRSAGIFGTSSTSIAATIFLVMAVVWLAMAIRHGLGHPRKGIVGLALGGDELRLCASVFGFVAVLSIVLFLLGFAVFLLVMIVAAAAAGALSGEDVAEAELFLSPQAFNEFLSSGGTGAFVSVVGGGIIIAATALLIWLILRLLPFAAATIDQKRFVVLQAGAWTRHHDLALIFGGLLTIGVGMTFIFVARYAIAQMPFPTIAAALLAHIVSCFGALLLIGFVCTVYIRLGQKAARPE